MGAGRIEPAGKKNAGSLTCASTSLLFFFVLLEKGGRKKKPAHNLKLLVRQRRSPKKALVAEVRPLFFGLQRVLGLE